jgi:hypothetical protein
MLNTAPLEIMASGDIELWAAPLGTAKPAVDAAPGAGWAKVGSYGSLNYSTDGVEIGHEQNIEKFRALGDTGVRKVARTEEDLTFKLTMWDLTLEQYAHALNGNPITTTAASSGVPGTKKIGLSRGPTVVTAALLFRCPSPYMTDGVMQYYCPRAAQTGTPAPAFKNDEPVGLELEWTALVDPAAANAQERFGFVEAQTAVAL